MAKYDIEIEMKRSVDVRDTLSRVVNAGEITYDAVLMQNISVSGIVTQGLLTNITNLSHIDLSKPWWDPAVNSMSVDNKNYLLGGDMLITDNNETQAVLFNKKLMSDNGLEFPYELAKEGKWTMDVMYEMMKGVAEDLNGDGKMTAEDDLWGFVGYNDALHALLIGGGGTLGLKDSGDLPYISFNEPRNLLVIDKIMDIMYDKKNVMNVQQGYPASEWTTLYLNTFQENRTLFQWMKMWAVVSYRSMEDPFGILPMPKYDEFQDNYYSVVSSYTGALLGVPQSADNLDRASMILEAMAAESGGLQYAYYEITLQRKNARDEESREMLDIIFNSRVYDIGACYNFGDIYVNFLYLCNGSKRDIVSFYDKNKGKMERAITNVVEAFQRMQ
jgi:hypothetical protein